MATVSAEVNHPYIDGKTYFIRTVTMYLKGTLVDVYPGELVLVNAVWVADTGRFSEAVKSGEFSEVEPYPSEARVIVSRAGIIDAVALD